MKQALTTGGQLSVWFASAQAALEKMGVADLIDDFEKPGLSGQHPEFGPIEIAFFVPEEGKTRMEIAVTDGQLISEFKQAVIPEYKKLLKAIAEGAVLPMEQNQPQEEPDAPTESSVGMMRSTSSSPSTHS